MQTSWLACAVGLLVAASTIVTASATLEKRDIFTFVPGINETQYSILTKAYYDAIFIANNALNPPATIATVTREWIFDKYFPKSAEDTVETIFGRIVGDDFNSGNATFSHMLVDIHDSHGYCANDPNKNYVNRDGSIITVCPNFWSAVGDHPERDCAEMPDDSIVSWLMTFPGDTILNLLIGFVGEKAIDGQDISNWQIDDKRSHTGAANAMYVKYHTQETAILSAMNYNWYALELYWTVKCGRTFRGPVNSYENNNGVCHGSHCHDGNSPGGAG